MIQRAITAPAWLTSGGIYQINPRTFCEAGTIAAVTAELPYLASLGFGTIYLCPIFTEDASENRENWSSRQKASETNNPKNPYRMNDYFHIDEEYGTMEDLAACVKECHRLGMRILLDLVYLHIGPNAAILQIHPEFAKQNPDGSFINGPWNFPLLDFAHPGLREYLWCNMVYYIGVLDVDGFRCDVGDGVPVDFWAEGRRRIRTVKPDALLINEGAKGETLLTGFDAIYGFSWHSCIHDILTGKKPASALQQDWERTHSQYPAGSIILRDMDNHDTVTDWPGRVETLAGHRGMDLIQVLNYVMDGVPMVYCGNELCDETKLSMFANRFHPGKFRPTPRGDAMKNTPEAMRRQEILRTMNGLREKDALYREGEIRFAEHDCPDTVAAFRREYADRSIWFAGNFSDHTEEVTLPDYTGEVILSDGAEMLPDGRIRLEEKGYILGNRDKK
ncbi:MAG: hypothetical protein IJB15_12450 [Clostridia bacterium]|nr:hypothetical protein [Clostridia bacterium]